MVVVVESADVDLASGLVWDLGVSGIEEHALANGDVQLRIGCEAALAHEVLAVLATRWSPTAESVAADAGLDAWRDHAQVWRVGSTVIVPPWLERPVDVGADDLVLSIDPGHAFGSASHETTRLCLGLIVELVTLGSAVADIGCGSGVLAIAAARCGAKRVVATDIAPEAILATMENANRNDVADLIEVSTASPDELDATSFHLVVANIGASTLCSMAADLVRITKLNGKLVLSGILGDQAQAVVSAFEQAGATSPEIVADGEWRTIVMTRPA